MERYFRALAVIAATSQMPACLKRRHGLAHPEKSLSSDFSKQFSRPETPRIRIESVSFGPEKVHILNISNIDTYARYRMQFCSDASDQNCSLREFRSSSLLLTDIPPEPQHIQVQSCKEGEAGTDICSKAAVLSVNLDPLNDEKLKSYLQQQVDLEQGIRGIAGDVMKALGEYSRSPSVPPETVTQIENIRNIGPGVLGDLYNSEDYFIASEALKKRKADEKSDDSSESDDTEATEHSGETHDRDEKRIASIKNYFTAGQIVLALGTPVFTAGLLMLISSRFVEKRMNTALKDGANILQAASNDLDDTFAKFEKTLSLRVNEIKVDMQKTLNETLDSILIRPENLESMTDKQRAGLYRHIIEEQLGRADHSGLQKFLVDNKFLTTAPDLGSPEKQLSYLLRQAGSDNDKAADFARKYLGMQRATFTEKVLSRGLQGKESAAVKQMISEAWGKGSQEFQRKSVSKALRSVASEKLKATGVQNLQLIHKNFIQKELAGMSRNDLRLKINGYISEGRYAPLTDLNSEGTEKLRKILSDLRLQPGVLLDDAMDGWYRSSIRESVNTLLVHNGKDMKIPIYQIMGSNFDFTIDDVVRGKVDNLLQSGEGPFRKVVKNNLNNAGKLADGALAQLTGKIDEATDKILISTRKLLNEAGENPGVRNILKDKTALYSKLLISDQKIDIGNGVKSVKIIGNEAAGNLRKYGYVATGGGLVVIAAGIAFTAMGNMQLTQEAEDNHYSRMLNRLGRYYQKYSEQYKIKMRLQTELADYLNSTYPE